MEANKKKQKVSKKITGKNLQISVSEKIDMPKKREKISKTWEGFIELCKYPGEILDMQAVLE
jgi:hypothetical protein